jgi:hypothetical protein
LLAAALLLAAATLLAVGAANGQAVSQSGNPAIDPQKIVHDASWNELHAKSPGRSFSYVQQKVDPKGSTVKQADRKGRQTAASRGRTGRD